MAGNDIETLKETITRLEREKYDLECQLQLLSEQYNSLLTKYNSQDSMSDMYQHDAFLSREQLNVAETKFEEAQLEIAELQAALEDAEERNRMIVANAKTLELEIATAERRHDELLEINEELVRENHDLRIELEELKRDHEGY
ncbi:hypothetical protein HII31_11503 [Pseudocercospora fuligena]|uniref:NUDE domain-containing protein n=1 Tax=Pseudocercospora fuligena TaxID=685502 RepID=A0A8H6VE18_9PEZI|nr:hypothetical protein HII31_11503 [Pseudocercospora fuligena]